MITLADALAAQADLMARLGGMAALATGRAPAILGSEVGRRPDGRHCVRVYHAATPGPTSALLAASWDGVPVEHVVTGPIVPMVVRAEAAGAYVARERPARCGGSVGHYEVTAGTIGALVELADRRLAILSNNHVLAAVNRGLPGDLVLQPGAVDGGTTSDACGHLLDFVPLAWDRPNAADCAVAFTRWSDLDAGHPAEVDPRHHTYTLDPAVGAAPQLGQAVAKEGRTTGLTRGQVVGINAQLAVSYAPEGGQASFVGQVRIQGAAGPFSLPGDSGSLIVTDPGMNPVALLFAGGGGDTFATPIAVVMQALGIGRFLNAVE